MKCPGCDHSLTQANVGSIDVDVCDNGCGGVWFDAKEIHHFDDKCELAGEKLVHIPRQPKSIRKAPPLSCPRCPGEPLVRQYFDSASKVEIDLCWSCGGVWLDTGELGTVRSQFESAAERQRAGDAFVADALRQHQLALRSKASEEVAEFNQNYGTRFRAIVSALRSIFDPLNDGVFR